MPRNRKKEESFNQYSSDPGGHCTCNNICNRTEKRGACPCLARRTFCADLCSCGTKKQACTNRSGRRGSKLSEILGIVSEDQSFDTSSDWSEGIDPLDLMVAFEDDDQHQGSFTTVIVPASDVLNESIQSVAEETYQHNNSLAVVEVPKKQKKRPIKKVKSKKVTQMPPVSGSTSQATSRPLADELEDISHEQLRNFVVIVLDQYPHLRDLLTGSTSSSEPPPPAPPGDDVPWCKCGRCRPMPMPEEQLCCRRTVGPCLLETAATDINDVVLRRNVVRVAIRHMNDLFAYNVNPANDSLRHASYRQFVLWRFDHLGSGNRVVIPSCVVWAIRNKFPSADGTYTGFKVARFT